MALFVAARCARVQWSVTVYRLVLEFHVLSRVTCHTECHTL